MQARFDYSGCNVFVAGGTSGINLGIAQAFAAAGARLGVGSRKQEKVDAAVAELGGRGPALGYAFDVRDPAAVAAAIAAFAGEAGPIDVLVSGAAGNFPAPAQRDQPERLQGGGRHRPARHLQRDEGRLSAHAASRAAA